uniref:STAS domain-containing protein n=1 Tax=Glossina morsitans morsitans TaxID=37546 RepID=A0A1B0G2R5_GLOMM
MHTIHDSKLTKKFFNVLQLSAYAPNRKSSITISNQAITTLHLSNKEKNDSKTKNQEHPTVFNSPKSFFEYQQKFFQNHYTDVLFKGLKPPKMSNIEANKEAKQPLTQAIINVKPKIQPRYDVHRDVLSHDVVIKETGYGARDKSLPYALKQCWHSWSFSAMFTGIIPILQWLPKYSMKRDFLGDVLAGFTVAVMHIPHGMAYGLLAGVSPGSGLYMAIFPTLIYMVFGTSRHISIGTFAVASLMTLSVVQTYASEEAQLSLVGNEIITPIEVVTALAFTVGLMHLLMSFLRLGTISALLSEPLVNGFTTGAACHVVITQLKDAFGLQVPRHKGLFKIIYSLIYLCREILHTNVATLIFCLSIMTFMTICNELIKPYLRKKCRFPVPAELMAVIGGTIVSMLLEVDSHYNIQLVGPIPTGLPTPAIPRLSLIPNLIADSLAIAVVTYSIVMSLGLTFAKKHSYEIRPNQELFAMGIGNIVGGFFSCIPLACSLTRSLIQEQTGGATQLASLVSAILIVMTLFWTGPFFRYLPRCVLAGVIIVALKPMFMQAKELKKFSKQGKLEVLTWLCTFIGVVLIDIGYGLVIGICISLLNLYIKGLRPYSCLLGYIPEASAVYVDISNHRNAFEVPETKMFRYTGALNFATAVSYRNALYKALELDIGKSKRSAYVPVAQNGTILTNGSPHSHLNTSFRFLVLDFSTLSHIDMAGGQMLSDIMNELKKYDTRMFIASPADRVYDSLVHSMAFGGGPFEIFPTLHDAVEYANACRKA